MADFTMDRFSLKGKTALVTGAERGIGLEIAKGLATAGADIIIAGLMEEEFPKAEAAVRAKGVNCTVLKTDISKEEDVLRLAEQLLHIVRQVHGISSRTDLTFWSTTPASTSWRLPRRCRWRSGRRSSASI